MHAPKVKVRARPPLFVISCSDLPAGRRNISATESITSLGCEYDKENLRTKETRKKLRLALSHSTNLRISVYVDIASIDYYSDELIHTKVSRLNRKFKLHKVKQEIWKCFANDIDDNIFWTELTNSVINDPRPEPFNMEISINSSGSLRYVETTKFLIDESYCRLKDILIKHPNKIGLSFKVDVSPTTRKWFETFLDANLLNSKFITFKYVSPCSSQGKMSASSISFKEYFGQLNKKFEKPGRKVSDELDSIIVITNNTGIKALLTVLSDRPLASYLDQESIEELSSMANRNNESLREHGRTRSLSLNRDANVARVFKTTRGDSKYTKTINSLPEEDYKRSLPNARSNTTSPLNYRISSGVDLNNASNSQYTIPVNLINAIIDKADVMRTSSSTSLKSDSTDLAYLEYDNAFNVLRSTEDLQIGNLQMMDMFLKADSPYSDIRQEPQPVKLPDEDDEDDGDEEDDEEDEDEDDDEDDDEGLSLYVPALLTRHNSRDNSNANVKNLNVESIKTEPRKARFRSLSLMEPARESHFRNDKNQTSIYSTSNDELTEQAKYTNVHVRDGDFEEEDGLSGALIGNHKKSRKRYLGPSTEKSVSQGLIPPEFYSRISSPATSTSSSGVSLTNLASSFDRVPDKFAQWLSENGQQSSKSKGDSLFEKDLINKSLDDLRRQKSVDVFSTFMNGNDNKNGLALNFKSTSTKGNHMKKALNPASVDDEEGLISGSLSMNTQSTFHLPGSSDSLNSQDEFSTTESTSTLRMQNHQKDPISTNLKKLRLQIYDEDESTSEICEAPVDSPPQTTIKRKVSIDLYGEKDNITDGGWVLGGNKR